MVKKKEWKFRLACNKCGAILLYFDGDLVTPDCELMRFTKCLRCGEITQFIAHGKKRTAEQRRVIPDWLTDYIG